MLPGAGVRLLGARGFAGVEERGDVVKWQGEELVKVRSESELRAGLLVVLTGCRYCGRTHSHILFSVLGRFADGWHLWATSRGVVHEPDAMGQKFRLAVETGRLYRLRDLDTSDEQTRTREREVVR